jgi:hypothetical protein
MRLMLGRIAWCGSQAVAAAFGGGVSVPGGTVLAVVGTRAGRLAGALRTC